MTPYTWHDEFDQPLLGPEWIDAYLPAWSSREATRANYNISDSLLRVSIPDDHPVWCPDTHTPPIRVSGIQSGNWSGPVGSTQGQQPFQEGLTVEQFQPEHWGWTPRGGEISIRARMNLSNRSMASAWLIGREADPGECAEICIFEIFGRDVRPIGARVGMGVHAFRDPHAAEDFYQTPCQIDPTMWHAYSIRWDQSSVSFSINDQVLKRVSSPPWYPMQLELAVFDFPEWGSGEDDQHVPWIEVDWIRHSPQ